MTTSSSINSTKLDKFAALVRKHFTEIGCDLVAEFGELTLIVPSTQLIKVAEILHDHPDFYFEQLIDLCGVDYSTFGQAEWDTENVSYTGFGRGVDRDFNFEIDNSKRFAVVYHLLSITNNQRLRLRTYVDSCHPLVDSVVPIWSASNWFEREAFDLYGILFRGHPDLRRILTDYGFIGHPFRKDFPLSGQVEMRYDSELKRVIYQQVSVEPRVLVPKVIRKDSRYIRTDQDKEGVN
ncbi:NADH-quinone oxidoreductase subunit C [Chromatium okenii]|jgi:NADH-quinone oxidoreductase subunit C|uniref:NADH-quinone oxidoreductase subunit C n=1 Tax=Chromatium okenii TaxID=61644 RepID=A0A2S7XUL2_9GAMM|nr:NADH-quinone oxidoreductase subunit C [Chromatium okenii]PQJ97434.1 NADH-quinone oxidoreductase subunit C [Chromatium okenii]